MNFGKYFRFLRTIDFHTINELETLVTKDPNQSIFNINIDKFENFILSLGTAQHHSLDQTLLPIIEFGLKNNLVIGFDPNYDFNELLVYLNNIQLKYSFKTYDKIIHLVLPNLTTEVLLVKKAVVSTYSIGEIQRDLRYSKNCEPKTDFWVDSYNILVYLNMNMKNIYINNYIYTNIRTWDYSKGFDRPIAIHSSIGHYYEYIPELANILLRLNREEIKKNIYHTFLKSIVPISEII